MEAGRASRPGPRTAPRWRGDGAEVARDRPFPDTMVRWILCYGGYPLTRLEISLSKADTPPPGRDPWADAIESATAHVRSGDTGGGEAARGPEISPTGRKVLLAFAGILVSAGVAVGVARGVQSRPAALAPASQAADLRVEASVLIEQIEAYRTERGELPHPSLLRPYLDEGYEYQVVDERTGRYVVRRTTGDVTVTYDGSLPLGLWVAIGGSSLGSAP